MPLLESIILIIEGRSTHITNYIWKNKVWKYYKQSSFTIKKECGVLRIRCHVTSTWWFFSTHLAILHPKIKVANLVKLLWANPLLNEATLSTYSIWFLLYCQDLIREVWKQEKENKRWNKQFSTTNENIGNDIINLTISKYLPHSCKKQTII